ncbi:MAG: 2-polyprenyl-3-methyl-6-methoxy-1,4-benzoquinone monooxygenase [Pseudomonadota bacterium]
MNVEPLTTVDRLVTHADRILRTVTGHLGHSDSSPAASEPQPDLSAEERKHAAALMRVNHSGEVCAQALYEGQSVTAHNPETRKVLQEAAAEEQEHLRWCEQRLDELDDRVSHLNPLFYAASFATGMVAGLLGDRVNLGFVAATEKQVVNHLEEHLASLPDPDQRSRAILQQMRDDEHRHGTRALNNGGVTFPTSVQRLMTAISKVMTRTTYHW